MAITVTDVPDLQRFEGRLDGELAGYLEYHKDGDVWSLNHAFTFPALRGNGVAAQVTKYALDAAVAAGARVRPVCPFVADYLAANIAANPEYAALTS
jgi:predicted GNAT family acetyltransferase